MTEDLDYNADFNYKSLPPEDVEIIFEHNMLRIRVLDFKKNPDGMGTIEDLDGTMYRGVEV